jgi:ABC-type multidrug transport system permease subunit
VEAASQAAAEEGLRVGKFALAVVPGAAGSDLVYRYDDARPEGRTARLLADQALQRAAGRQDALPTRDALVQEVGSRYIDFLLPGLIGTNLLSSGIWGIGYSVVEARRKRLLKRLSVTPMSRADYLLSYLVMRLLMTALEVGALLLFGMLVFAVPMRGNCGLFVGVVLLAALTFGALGLLIASRLRSIDGASGLMYFVMLPMWLGSGVFFPFSNFPDVLQPAIRLLPLTAAVSALRGVMLEGMGLGTIMPQLSVLAIWSVTTFALALKVFRWR